MTRQLRELEVLEVLIAQGAVIPCFRCGIAFTKEDVRSKNIENEHLHEKKLGGADGPENRRFSHKPCHALVTHGNGATFAGSSRHKIKKATDPNRIEKFVVNKQPPEGHVVEKRDPEDGTALCRDCGDEYNPRLPHHCPNKPSRERHDKGAPPLKREYFWPPRKMQSRPFRRGC